jgi:rubrerythrin
LIDRSGEAAANLDNINKATADAQLNLDGIQQKAKKESDRIEFAENTLLLYEDPSQIPPSKLAELDVMLQRIIEARFNVNHLIYPIDYKSLKDKAVLLLEQAVGKSLVPRELFDDILNRFAKLTNDLLFDRLGKMEKDKSDLTVMKREIGQLSIEKATKVALELQAKGDIRVHRCKGCQSTTAFSPATGIFCKNIWTCPVCNTTNPTAAIDT